MLKIKLARGKGTVLKMSKTKEQMQLRIFELEGALLTALITLEEVHPMNKEEPCVVYEKWIKLLSVLGLEPCEDEKGVYLSEAVKAE